jgi:hypothetical protein
VNLGILASCSVAPAALLNTNGSPYEHLFEHTSNVTTEAKRWAKSDREQTKLATQLAGLIQKLSAVESEAPPAAATAAAK